MIILFAGEKGGSGKSTLAVHIAIERALKEGSVVLIDADPQGTATNWITRREQYGVEPKIHCAAMRSADFTEKLPALAEQYDDIIIDVAGRDSREMRSALSFSDVAVFPLRPTLNDLETAANIDTLVSEFQGDDFYLQKAFFVLSQASTNIFRSGTNQDAIDYLSDYGNIDLCSVSIGMRSSFEKASIEGCSVSELAPPDGKARKEVDGLYNAIFS